MATRGGRGGKYKTSEEEGHTHPPEGSKTGRGRGGMAYGGGAGYGKTTPKTPPKKTTTRHVHASSSAPKGAPEAPKKGRQSSMTSSSSKGRTSKKIPQGEKKRKQLKRSKAWAKRYATGGKDDRN